MRLKILRRSNERSAKTESAKLTIANGQLKG
jgi:hypothetical protein